MPRHPTVSRTFRCTTGVVTVINLENKDIAEHEYIVPGTLTSTAVKKKLEDLYTDKGLHVIAVESYVHEKLTFSMSLEDFIEAAVIAVGKEDEK